MIIIRSQDKTNLMQINQIKIDGSQVYAVFESKIDTVKIGDYENNTRYYTSVGQYTKLH